MSTQSGSSAHAVRQTQHKLLSRLAIIFLLLLLSMLSGLIALHPLFTYQTYQQGSCSISSGYVRQESTKSGYRYIAVLEYTLQTKDGQQADSSDQVANDITQEEAQQAVNQYNVGQTYQCWYNPAEPTRTKLVLPTLTAASYAATFILTSIGCLLAYAFLWFLYYYGVHRPRRLIRYGVMTEGRVAERFNVKLKNGVQIKSRIVFSPLDDSSHTYKVETDGQYELGSPQPVCYDPLNPGNARYGGRPGGGGVIGWAFMLIVGIMVMGVILAIVWNAS